MMVGSAKKSIALDISEYSLKAVHMTKKRGGIYIDVIKNESVPHGYIDQGRIKNKEGVSALIAKILKEVQGGSAASRFVDSVLPDTATYIKLIELDVQNISSTDLQAEIIKEAAHHIPYNLDDVYLDWQEIENISKKHMKQILIGVCPKDVVDEYIQTIHAAGFIPKSLEIESLAITRSIFRIGSSMHRSLSNRNVIVIDVGAARSSLIFWREQKFFNYDTIEFSISVPLSGVSINRTIEETLRLTPEQAEEFKKTCGLREDTDCKGVIKRLIDPILHDLIVRLNQAVDFHTTHFQGASINQIVLCGGGAYLRGLDVFLSKEMRIPVMIADPYVNIKNRTSLNYPHPLEFCTVIGLGLKDFF